MGQFNFYTFLAGTFVDTLWDDDGQGRIIIIERGEFGGKLILGYIGWNLNGKMHPVNISSINSLNFF